MAVLTSGGIHDSRFGEGGQSRAVVRSWKQPKMEEEIIDNRAPPRSKKKKKKKKGAVVVVSDLIYFLVDP